jgi:TATA-box binding protein (TBP) (component of TFIID and TFIIIB)
MEIFADVERKLIEYKNNELLFTTMENSTCTVKGSYDHVEHTEEELTELLECTYPITDIDSNFGHKTLPGYEAEKERRKSNRGRKKKPKPIKTRKFQGDGSGFNSQISFSVLGIHIRKRPMMVDKHSSSSRSITDQDKSIVGWKEEFLDPRIALDYECVTKKYKLKIFRNGKFTVPGVLQEDLSDIIKPLEDLRDYFRNQFNDTRVEIKELFSVMRNYKFRLLTGSIDIKRLQKHCSTHFQSLLNTKFSDIEEFLVNPIFEGEEFSPRDIGWRDYFHNSEFGNKIPEKKRKSRSELISAESFRDILKESNNVKNLYINFNTLMVKLKEVSLEKHYVQVRALANVLSNIYLIEPKDEIIKTVLKYMLTPHLESLQKGFHKSKDNMLSHIKYDPEKYPGFLIKVKTPNYQKTSKLTTIKIFPSGKINIDGANNREEAEFIYYWLNNLFCENKNLIYNDDIIYEDHDEEFPSGSDEE